jgi:L-arabinose isomerase
MKSKKGRIPRALRQQRIRRVMDLLGEGLYSYEIASKLANEWECSERSIYAYLEVVKKMISKEVDRQDVNDLMSKFDHLYQIAMKEKKWTLANQILTNKAKFQVGEKGQIDIDINLKNLFGFKGE